MWGDLQCPLMWGISLGFPLQLEVQPSSGEKSWVVCCEEEKRRGREGRTGQQNQASLWMTRFLHQKNFALQDRIMITSPP